MWGGSMDMPKVMERALNVIGISKAEAVKKKNYEVALIGCQLMYLKVSDVIYMLDDKTTDYQATARLITRRKAS